MPDMKVATFAEKYNNLIPELALKFKVYGLFKITQQIIKQCCMLQILLPLSGNSGPRYKNTYT